MKLRFAQVFPVILMLALALGTLWLDRLVQLPPVTGKDKQRHDPDFIVEKFTVTQMSATGHPETSLTAPKMLHYPDDETTVLEHPRFLQTPIGGAAVEIVGTRGVVSKEGDLVRVEGDVRMTRAAFGDRAAMVIETSAIDIEPKTRIARSDEEVVITEGVNQLRGVGMMMNNDSREFELKSRVQGTIQVKKRP
jgi:lipopolysaccharide export system protein LptC